MREADGWKTVRRPRSTGRSSIHRRPVDPHQEGRRSCRELVICRFCRQGGHRQASLFWTLLPKKPAITGLFACLVGEVRDVDPQWVHIIAGIQALCPKLTSPNCHRLTVGDIFICGLPKEAWRRIHDQTQKLNGGGSIFWRQPQPMDGAFPTQKTTRRLEACGVPFGLRTWRHLEQLTRPIGALQKVVCNGLHAGDPNCLCLDVEMETDMIVPRKIPMAGGGVGRPRDPPRHLAAPPTAHLPTFHLQLWIHLADSPAPAAPGAADTADKWYPPAPVTATLHAQAGISSVPHRYASRGGDGFTDSAGHVTLEGG